MLWINKTVRNLFIRWLIKYLFSYKTHSLIFHYQCRLNAFLERERGRKVITLKEGSGSRWSYFTHCAALSVLVAAGVSNAPLLHDYTVVYKGSLDDMILACIIGGILHLFFWVVIWLFLTIKQNWMFKLQATVCAHQNQICCSSNQEEFYSYFRRVRRFFVTLDLQRWTTNLSGVQSRASNSLCWLWATDALTVFRIRRPKRWSWEWCRNRRWRFEGNAKTVT